MTGPGKPLVWLHRAIRTPPLSNDARREAGFRLRMLQNGERLGMPHSRPMPAIGPRCHELRIHDQGRDWRVLYRADSDAIVILEAFEKKTMKTPPAVIAVCRKRIKEYDAE